MPAPLPAHLVTAKLTADRETIKVGEEALVNLRLSGLGEPGKKFTELTWGIEENNSSIRILSGDIFLCCCVIGDNPGTATLIAKWKYTDPLIKGDTEARITISVILKVTASSSSGGGSGDSGGSGGSGGSGDSGGSSGS